MKLEPRLSNSFDSDRDNMRYQMIGNVILSQDAGRSLDKTNLYSVKTQISGSCA